MSDVSSVRTWNNWRWWLLLAPATVSLCVLTLLIVMAWLAETAGAAMEVIGRRARVAIVDWSPDWAKRLKSWVYRDV